MTPASAGDSIDAVQHCTVIGLEVVGRGAARVFLMAFDVPGEVGTDHGVAVTHVRRHVNALAADIDLLVVVGRNFDGEGPVEAFLDPLRRPADGRLGPNLDVSNLHGLEVDHVAAGVEATRPSIFVGHLVDATVTRLASAVVSPVALGLGRRHRKSRPFGCCSEP